MATQKQIEANRRNALRSTGPRSAEGKARSSRNAAKHGLRSRRDVVPPAEQWAFDRHRRAMIAELAPATEEERVLAEELVLLWWKLERFARLEASLLNRDHELAAEDLRNRGGGTGSPDGGEPGSHAYSAAFGRALHISMSGRYSPYAVLTASEGRAQRALWKCMDRLRALKALRVTAERQKKLLPTNPIVVRRAGATQLAAAS